MATATKETPKQTLQQQLDAITFKNEQAQKIKAVQEGKQRLKDNLGRNKQRFVSTTDNISKRISSAGKVAGLQTLGK